MTTTSIPPEGMEVITLKEAKALGLSRYFTGKPCPKGHIAERDLDRHCIVCASIKHKHYRAENRDRIKLAADKFSAANPEYFKYWRDTNRGKLSSYRIKWKESNYELWRKQKIT
jgi:hypothetical protein